MTPDLPQNTEDYVQLNKITGFNDFFTLVKLFGVFKMVWGKIYNIYSVLATIFIRFQTLSQTNSTEPSHVLKSPKMDRSTKPP